MPELFDGARPHVLVQASLARAFFDRLKSAGASPRFSSHPQCVTSVHARRIEISRDDVSTARQVIVEFKASSRRAA